MDNSKAVVRCCVPNCTNSSSQNNRFLKFFPFPDDTFLAIRWEIKCNLQRSVNREVDRVCSAHFKYSDYTDLLLAKEIKKNSIPSLYLKLYPKDPKILVDGPVPAQLTSPIIKREFLIEDKERSKEVERLRSLQATEIDENPLLNGARNNNNNYNLMPSSPDVSSQSSDEEMLVEATIFSYLVEEGMESRSPEEQHFLIDRAEEPDPESNHHF